MWGQNKRFHTLFLAIYVNVNTLKAYREHFKYSKYLKREIIYSIFKTVSPLFQYLKKSLKGGIAIDKQPTKLFFYDSDEKRFAGRNRGQLPSIRFV